MEEKVVKNKGNKPKEASSSTVKVKLVRSAIRRPKDQGATLIGLGLTKMNKIKELKDTPEVRGMIKKVAHLVEIVK